MAAGGRPRARMRVQIQEQRGSKTVHHDSEALFGTPAKKPEVAVQEALDALERMRASRGIPRSKFAEADAALERARMWVRARPPSGVSGTYSWSFEFDPLTPDRSFRFDIENIFGQNLRR